MPSITTLCGKLLILYLLVVAGFVATRILNTRKETIAPLLIYIITPAVVFTGAIKARLELQYLVLPFLIVLLASGICLFSFAIARRFFPSPSSNILALAAGSSNSGYFGLPVGIALFGEDKLSLLVMCSMGFTLFENTLGFYITARGRHSPTESFARVLKLPGLYAFFAGLALNAFGVSLSGPLEDLLASTRGAYSVLGMMIIGMGVADIKAFHVDAAFSLFVTCSKFILWPLAGLAVLYLDARTLSILSPTVRSVVFFMCALPPAANTVAFAAELRAEPEKAAVAVLLTSLLAIVLVPLLNGLFPFVL